MANAQYDPYKVLLLTTGLNLATDDIRAILTDLADYTFATTHSSLTDVAAGARVGQLAAGLGSKTTLLGVFDSDDDVYSSVSGDESEAIVLYSHTGGSDAARLLVGYYDTGMTGIPVTPNGGDINLLVNASGWFNF